MGKAKALVFDPRKLSVAGVERELKKRPDLTVAELKALLKREGSQVRPRGGVERLVDARLAAVAEAALEAVAEDMHEVKRKQRRAAADAALIALVMAPDLDVALAAADAAEAEAEAKVAGVEGQPATDAGPVELGAPLEVLPPNGPEVAYDAPPEPAEEPVDPLPWEDEPEAEGETGFAMEPEPAEELHGPTHDAFGKEPVSRSRAFTGPVSTITVPAGIAVAEPEAEPDLFEELEPEIKSGAAVHLRMLDGMVHEGHFVERAEGAMVRLRDGRDTLVFVPNERWWLTPKPTG